MGREASRSRGPWFIVGVVIGVMSLAAVGLVTVKAFGDHQSRDSGDPGGPPPASTVVLADFTILIDRSGLGDPLAVDIPPATDDAPRIWLDGDGAIAAGLAPLAQRLWAEGASSCTAVAHELDAVASPEAMVDAAAQTPDEPTRQILLGLLGATQTALRSCGDPEAFETAQAELAWQWALTDRRLREIGVDQ